MNQIASCLVGLVLASSLPAAGMPADAPAPRGPVVRPAAGIDAAREVEALQAALPTLDATVSIDLDAVDVPTIRAETLEDAVRAEGWMHARERFLQMDLARRQAAGELGMLFPQAVALDRRARPLGLRAVARRALAGLPAGHARLLSIYAEGVNAQLSAGAPLEYRMIKLAPEPWLPEDTLLVQLGMAKYLDSSAEFDQRRAALYAAVGPELGGFFASSAGVLSMSIDGAALPAAPALPSAGDLDLRTRGSAPRQAVPATDAPRETVPGSNAFAVAGSRTKDGRAIVGNDMHLALTAPGIWYRVALEWNGGRLLGLSLPGVPLVVQGTNGKVAWAFTNLTADLSDLVVVDIDPKDPARYLVDGGSEAFVTEEVTLGRAPRDEPLQMRSTRWGPVIGSAPDGRPIALRWVFLEPGALDCGVFELAHAQTLEAALEAARNWRGPPQNTLVAAADGRIGWTIAGSLPARPARTPVPVSWRSAPAWNGVLPSAQKPIIVDPASGVLTSGNQLSIAPTGALASVLGGDESAGDRAHRLRALIAARSDWTERELHEVQLDVHSARLLRWRDALIAALPADLAKAGAGDAALAARDAALAARDAAIAARGVIEAWNGMVDADATAPEILDACRRTARAAFAAAIARGAAGGGITPAAEGAGTAAVEAGIEDEPILRALEARAPNLVPAADGDWAGFAVRVLAAAADETRIPGTEGAIAFRTRGASNICAIRHPAADSLGAAARMAEMPRAQLPGHPTCVRVQTPTFGASERSVISPAHLADAVLVTPCGQAGMPTSPHFRNLHLFWQKGEPYPLVPGDAKRRVLLQRELAIVPAREPAAASPK